MPEDSGLFLQPDIKVGAVTHGDRTADFHPGDWQREPHKIRPIETAPLTAYGDRMGSKETGDHRFYMLTQPYNALNGAVADVYLTPALANAYVSGGVEDQTVFLGVTRAVANSIRKGNTMMVHRASNGAMVFGEITDVHRGSDTDSYLAFKLLADDTNNDLAGTGLTYTLTGYAAAEKNQPPEGLYEEAKKYENYTQEFQEAVEFTRRELNTIDRVGGGSIEARGYQQAMVRLDKLREYARFLGIKKDQGGGKTMTGGIWYWLNALLKTTNIISYVTDSTYVQRTGQRYEVGGVYFWRNLTEYLSRYYTEGAPIVAWGGGLGIEAVQQAFMQLGQFTLTTNMSKIGLRVMTLQGLARDVKFIQHPLFAANDALQRTIVPTVPAYTTTRHHKGLGLEMVRPGQRTGRNYTSVDTHMVRVDEGMQIGNMLPFAWTSGHGLTNAA